jgi:hypothetical protein
VVAIQISINRTKFSISFPYPLMPFGINGMILTCRPESNGVKEMLQSPYKYSDVINTKGKENSTESLLMTIIC